MHPWTQAHWTHSHLSHCCWHPCHQSSWGQGKADAVEAQEMGPLQNKRIPLAWDPLPHQFLLGGYSCLVHGEGKQRTGMVERPPRMHKGGREAWLRE